MMEILTTHDTYPELVRKLESAPKIGLDFETTSASPQERAPIQFDLLKVVGFGFGFEDGDKTYVPIAHSIGENIPEAIDLLNKVLTDPTKTVWAHNAKFEKTVTKVLGIEAQCGWRCSMLAQWLLNKGLPGKKGHKLKPAVEKYLGRKMLTWEEVVPTHARAHMVAPSTMSRYCSDDAFSCLELGEFFMKELHELDMEKVFFDLEMPFIDVLIHMDEAGAAIDRDYLRDLYDIYNQEMVELDKQFRKMTGVSISKNQAISIHMFDKTRAWPIPDGLERGASGTFSIAEKVRNVIRPLLSTESDGFKILELKDRYQILSKIVSTYTLALIKRADRYTDGRIRSDWRQHGTDTGRLASRDPNLQNIPIRREEGKKIRKAFISEEGWKLYDADYKGADLRMMAHLSHDPVMIRRFKEDRDLHQETANDCHCSRRAGKTANLGLIYEMGWFRLSQGVGCSEAEAKLIWKEWHRTYPMVQRYHKRMHAYAEEYGYVRTMTGRVRMIPNINSKNSKMKAWARRLASNTPCQGSVADLIKIAMRNLHKEWADRGVLYDWYTKQGKAKITLQVHDELLVELRNDFAEEGASDIRRHLENAVQLRVPMRTDGAFGETWYEAH